MPRTSLAVRSSGSRRGGPRARRGCHRRLRRRADDRRRPRSPRRAPSAPARRARPRRPGPREPTHPSASAATPTPAPAPDARARAVGRRREPPRGQRRVGPRPRHADGHRGVRRRRRPWSRATASSSTSRAPVPFDVEWYRLGWYGGAGARLVHRDVDRPRRARPVGLVHRVDRPAWRRHWPPAVTATVPDDVARAASTSRSSARPTARPRGRRRSSSAPRCARRRRSCSSRAGATWQAYNAWGGKSLYSYNSRRDHADRDDRGGRRQLRPPVRRRRRPGLPPASWELPVHPLDGADGPRRRLRAGHRPRAAPRDPRGRVGSPSSPGHAEYWSRPMRASMERAVARGDERRVLQRERDLLAGAPRRLGAAARVGGSPATSPRSATRCAVTQPDAHDVSLARGARSSSRRRAFLGVMYGHVVQRPRTGSSRTSGHWLYEGTGLRDGDRIVVPRRARSTTRTSPTLAPPGTVVIARSPVPFVGRDPDAFGDVKSPAMQSATVRDPASGAGGGRRGRARSSGRGRSTATASTPTTVAGPRSIRAWSG